ncbi:DUF2200 domain-containing protein [Wenxinia saemankumensis]|nr:DUF2200 domain-containing protein [Wenxinia saemankumensis]
MAGHRVYGMRFGSVHPLYVRKVERKGRSAEEVDAVIRWQTGYDQAALEARIGDGTDFRAFFDGAPAPNPARLLVTGKICGIRVEEIEDPLMREIRILDKLVDELARGRPMEKVLRRPSPDAPA